MTVLLQPSLGTTTPLSDSFIADVKARNNIVEVIAEHIPTKKLGTAWAGVCPFHLTQTFDAFRINEQKGLYHCFNCEAAGDVIDFVMRIEHLTFQQAVERLARRAGIPLPQPQVRKRKVRPVEQRQEPVWDVAARFYAQVLWSKQGEKALAYLHQRGLSDHILRQQQVGYAPGGAALREHLLKQGYTTQQIMEAKLLSDKGQDYFWRVITFPVIKAGQVVHFTSRRVGAVKNPHVHFRGEIQHLYNEAILLAGKPVILVEGIIDCLTLLDQGFPNVVATYGTQGLKPAFVERFKGVSQVYLCFDSDPKSQAGQKASQVVRSLFEQAGIPVAVVHLPEQTEKVDVNDFFSRLKRTPADFQALLDQADSRTHQELPQEAPAPPEPISQPQAAPSSRQKLQSIAERGSTILERVQRTKQAALSTGSQALDDVLNGGLQTGLYLLAATPSSGKTTFCMQIADTVAAQANVPVLFVSYEQGEAELHIKSLSRVGQIDSRDIFRGTVNRAKLLAAAERYQPTGKFVYLVEANHLTTIEEIQAMAAELQQQHHSERVLVVVDYLQSMPALPGLRDDKQRVDYLVTELRRLARSLNSPVIAISSLRKGGWSSKGQVGLEELKESASLGYGADVVAILESGRDLLSKISNSANGSLPTADRRVLDSALKAHPTDDRLASVHAVLRIIKNRNGTQASVLFQYVKAFNQFIPVERGKLGWTGSEGG
ncbi:MAG: AAA family ATPase [Anaerolineae bacterium]|nr:AAA family ATPase [Anaerolineae bacterium]